MLGSSCQCGDVKATCTVRRRTAFWDALAQLPVLAVQQGTAVEQHPALQGGGAVKLAKLFPRFLDEHLSPQPQQQQQQAPSLSHQLHNTQALTVHPGGDAVGVEAGEGHGPRKEFFEAVARNWTTATGPQHVSVTCKASADQLLSGSA